jgi:histidyl-tRNA synthetase
MPSQFDPPSGTRDFLAADVERREHVLSVIRSVVSRYGFEPLQTPAFERLDVLLGKYGDEGDKLVFKILRRGEHEATGEADLALRYDMTVPLARVAAAYGSQLPVPYKRYAIGPVWRADRPGRDRYREFVQCDLDTLGSASVLADAEALCAQHDALADLGLPEFRIQLNSRRVLAGLLEAFSVPADIGPQVLISLDKLDKNTPAEVVAELVAERSLDAATAGDLVTTLTAPDAADRLRVALKQTDTGTAGLDEVDTVLALVAGQVPAERIAFTPRMVRGLSYYTGPIWEVVAPGVASAIGSGGRYDHLIAALGGPDVPGTGSSIGVDRILGLLPDAAAADQGRLDVAVTVLGQDLAVQAFGFAATARQAGLRSSVYLGGSRKLARQLKWASDSGARWCLIYGDRERQAGVVTVRNMVSGEQAEVAADELSGYLAGLPVGRA